MKVLRYVWEVKNGIEHKESSSKHAVAFRFRGAKPVPNVGTYMEFPSLPNAGLMTLHVRNGNATAAAILELQQYNEIESTWSIIKTFDLKPYGEVNIASLDEIVTFDVNSPSEIKLRLIGGPKFIYMYRVDIAAYEASGLNTVKTSSFKLAGRILTTSTPVAISLFNSIGVKVFEKTIQNEVDFPASLGKGIFFVKSELGTQKIFLN